MPVDDLDVHTQCQLALQASHAGIWDWSPQTGVVRFDARCRELLGLPADAIITVERFKALLHPDDRARWKEVSIRSHDAEAGGAYVFDHRVVGDEGESARWVAARGTCYFDVNGRPSHFIGTLVDITEQRRAEAERERLQEELRVSEEWLLLAADATGVGTFDYDETADRLRMSPRGNLLFGLARDATPTRRELIETLHPDDRNRVRVVILSSTDPAGRGGSATEYRCLWPDGSTHWIASRTRSLFREVDGTRRAVRTLGTLMDITERRLAEEAVFAEEKRLAVTLRSIGDGMIAADGRLFITDFNDVAEKLTGWPRAEAMGRPLYEVFRVINEDTRAPVDTPAARVLREGKAVKLANHSLLIRRDGTEWPIADSCSPIRNSLGQVTGAVLVFREQKDERCVEAALVRSRNELRNLISALPIGVVVSRGGRGSVVYANPMFATYLGYPDPSELSGKGVEDLLVRAEFEEAYSEAQKGASDEVRTHEWRFVRKDGQEVTLEAIAWREIEFEGEPSVLYVLRDLTEMRAMQAQLMQADRMVSVGTLAAGVAHEINNPLAYLIASLDYLDEQLKSAPLTLPGMRLDDMRRALAEARDGAGRVRHVVRDLKTFSRVEQEERRPVDVRSMIDTSISMASNEIKFRARLVKQYGDIPLVVANETRLGQVLLNLLINATQAISEGHVEENEIDVVTRTDARGWAIVEVRDSGAGIPPNILPRIFDPFFTTKPMGVGTGLGLSICRNIVLSLNGEITVESQMNHGTLVRIGLPPAPAIAPLASGVDEAKPAPGKERGGRRGRVLVVDDEPAIGSTIRRLLSAEHDVVVVPSAIEALERLTKGERYDVILSDLMMPKMTGMELYDRLKALAPDSAERMILMTGGAFTAGANQFLDRVPNPRLEKPFDATNLRALVRRIVG